MNQLENKQVKLIATYARVSDNPDEVEQSIKNQTMVFNEMADKNNWQIIQEYKDDDWGGDFLERPELDRLRIDAKSKDRLWEAVLIYDQDRLARRYSFQELVIDELQEAGVEVIFTKFNAPKNPDEKIMFGVRGLFAEYERAKITERFRLGKRRKAKEGHILTTKPLYGYDYIPKKDNIHGYYQINDTEARVVRMIYSWVANEKMTLRAIVKRLQELDIKPRNSKRGVWSTSTLSTLLRHRGYIGEAHYGASYAVVPINPTSNQKYKKTKKTSRKLRPQEEWITIPIPPLIEKDLFEKAGNQLKVNFALCKRNKKNDYLLSGKIRCTCGKQRHGEGYYNKPNLYYRCDDRTLNFPLPPQCKEKGINARIVDNLVWKRIENLMSSPDLLKSQIERWLKTRKNKTTTSLTDVEVLKREVTKLNEQFERYNKGYGVGVFTLEQLKVYTTPLREQIIKLENQIGQSTREARQIDLETPTDNDIKSFAKHAKQTLHDMDFTKRRQIILSSVDKVIANREQIQVIGHIPVNNYVKQHSLYRNRWPAQCGQVNLI